MKPAISFFVLITFGVLGSIFLGLVAGLANVITNEYVDYSLHGNPVVQEYDFRVGGKYELVTFLLLLGGSGLAIGGNVMVFMLFATIKLRGSSFKARKNSLHKTYCRIIGGMPAM